MAHTYVDPKTLEREGLLKRMRELDAERAQLERNLREGEARLLIEEQFESQARLDIENPPKKKTP
jgi:hypothetical protein